MVAMSMVVCLFYRCRGFNLFAHFYVPFGNSPVVFLISSNSLHSATLLFISFSDRNLRLVLRVF